MSKDQNTKETRTPTPPRAQLTRDEIRAKVFGAKPKVEVVEDFFGADIELRQPILGTVLEMRQQLLEDSSVRMLTDFTYVPGTDERVFEPADGENLLLIPFGPEMQRLTNAVNKLMGVDLEGLRNQVADAKKSDSAGTSEADDDDGSGGAGEN